MSGRFQRGHHVGRCVEQVERVQVGRHGGVQRPGELHLPGQPGRRPPASLAGCGRRKRQVGECCTRGDEHQGKQRERHHTPPACHSERREESACMSCGCFTAFSMTSASAAYPAAATAVGALTCTGPGSPKPISAKMRTGSALPFTRTSPRSSSLAPLPSSRSAVALLMMISSSLATPLRREEVLTVSPRTVYSMRFLEPMLPATSGPLLIPTPNVAEWGSESRVCLIHSSASYAPRHAASAWFSRSTGTLNRTMMWSPMNLLTVPWFSLTLRTMPSQ